MQCSRHYKLEYIDNLINCSIENFEFFTTWTISSHFKPNVWTIPAWGLSSKSTWSWWISCIASAGLLFLYTCFIRFYTFWLKWMRGFFRGVFLRNRIYEYRANFLLLNTLRAKSSLLALIRATKTIFLVVLRKQVWTVGNCIWSLYDIKETLTRVYMLRFSVLNGLYSVPAPSVFTPPPQLQIICCYIARYYVKKVARVPGGVKI